MAFALRRPFAIVQALRQTPSSSKTLLRTFHNATPKNAFQPVREASKFQSARQTFQQTFRRNQSQMTYNNPVGSGNLRSRLLYGGAIFGGTLLAVNLIFNRETREDGGMPPYERQYLNDTFLHTGLGLGIIAVAARALHANGWSYRLMTANPWLVMGVGIVGSLGTMIACRATPPEK